MSSSYENDPSIITSIEKSKSDKFDCLIKILPNGLKALLVSDPESENSAASLTVNIGSLTDKPDELGLAHFCEHLLFMGTEKYPSENEYDEYLSKNGGSSNASTGEDDTTYYFDVNNEAFEGALDRFAQFFISSLFDENSVEREIKAVDSEFSKNKNNDTWRLIRFFQILLNPQSPFSQVSTGNKDSLNHKDIRDRLLKMYKKYYTSEIMTLCVYSNMSLESQINLVEKLFKNVPKLPNFEKPRYDLIKPYDLSKISKLYKIVPVKDQDSLIFKWYFPYCDNYYAKPLNFFSALFGHEGPFTLTANLKKDNLITDLVTSREPHEKVFLTMQMKIVLTKKGYENYKEVILRVLKYIEVIKSKKINKRYFDEVKTINQITFDFQDKEKPIDFVERYSENLHKYKPQDVFIGDTIFKEYNENLIRKYLDMINLDNLVILFLSKNFENECKLTEKLYEIKYAKADLDIKKEDIDLYQCPDNFDYPPENKFCPKNMELLPIENPDIKYPELIYNEENCKVYFLQDKEFKLPKGMIKFNIKFTKNLCNNSDVKNEVIAHLLKKIIKLELNEILYMAEESEVEFKLSIYHELMIITISGFNDSLKSGLEEFLTHIKNFELSEKHKEVLEIQKREYLKKLKNFFLKKSYKIGMELINDLLINGDTNRLELIDFMEHENISMDDLINFQKNMFNEIKSNWLIQGNFTKQIALDIVQSTIKIFNLNINSKINKEFQLKRIVKLNPNINYTFRLLSPNKNEHDSSIVLVYQLGHLLNEEKMYYKILESFLYDKFYDSLRTKETLGYIVNLSKLSLNEVYHILCVVQSNSKDPEYCNSRIINFFKEKEKDIKDITDEDFISHVKSIMVEETRKDIDLEEQFDRNWDEISKNRFKFNRKEENAKWLKKCNKEGFIKFYEKYIINDIKKLDVEYVCEEHWKNNENELKEEIKNCENIKKRIVFDKISDFQDCNSLYPCITSIHYRQINS